MRKLIPVILGVMWFAGTCAAASSSSSSASNLLPYTILPSNIAYFAVTRFDAATARKIRPTMEAIAKVKPRGLILDLRNNQGGEFETARALIESLLNNRTPFIRNVNVSFRGKEVTSQKPVFRASIPVVAIRNQYTVNEPDIVIYVLKKIRKGGMVEFSPGRAALQRAFKQNDRMKQYLPIKEASFFVSPDNRVIGNEGGSESDMIGTAEKLIREMSPWEK